MIKKESLMEMLINNGISQENAEEITNNLQCILNRHLAEKENRLNGLIDEQKDKIKCLIENKKELVSRNITQLEAIKMLFDINRSGHTHREKEIFCNQAKTVIEQQIKQLKCDMQWIGYELPF